MKTFDRLFYKDTFTTYAHECASRFYEVVEKYPEWLGTDNTNLILKLYKGYLKRAICIVVQNHRIIRVIDV